MLAGLQSGRHTGLMAAIHAPRLSDGEIGLRALAATDVPAIVAACQDPEIKRWTTVPSPYTREDARRFLAVAAIDAAAGTGVALAVCDPRDRLFGTVGLTGIDGTRAEIGYWIAAPARGHGAATRAVALLRDWAQRELGVGELALLAQRDNRPSRRVAERSGFSDTGELRDGLKLYAWCAPAPRP